jgi:photoactive yellow protein
MNLAPAPSLVFDQPDLLTRLDALDAAGLDAVSFGVIGFDLDGVVTRYGAAESRMAGLRPERVVGLPLFGVVAQCMNNYLVAQRFEDAAAAGQPLDATVDYVLTLRMKPVQVQLRLLAAPGGATRYVCILRRA